MKVYFDWDEKKNLENQNKHDVSFEQSQLAFLDERRIIAVDTKHTTDTEKRYYCFGKTTEGIMTVRFTYRDNAIRIIGAGFWRKGKKVYEEKNKV